MLNQGISNPRFVREVSRSTQLSIYSSFFIRLTNLYSCPINYLANGTTAQLKPHSKHQKQTQREISPSHPESNRR